MCDQTEVSYLEDDVVWVKIGPIWWPGVVKDLEKDDEGKEILASLKKKPIAAVKFFQEDNYEFVKNLDHIYHYNCRRKDEFIKKGLDKFRTGAPHMKKFPADVTNAESLTNGDVNIINDPRFYPEKKESYSEIFGSGKKKNKKDCELSPRPRGRPSSNVTPYRPITHQRFINKVLRGESDHRVKTLIQCNSSPDDGVSRNPYKCHICKFETSRVNVIVAHHRLSHSTKNSINWTGSDSKLMRKKPVFKSRKIKHRKLFQTSKDDDGEESEEEESERKKSPKNKNLKEKVKTPEKNKSERSSWSPKRKSKESSVDASEPKKKRFTDVLLADWDEEEDDEKKKGDGDEKKENDEEEKEKKDENISESVEQSEKPSSPKTRKNQNEKMSCFDFDEEEEGFIGMSNANTYGRKIPRVIPVKDKSELGMDLEIEELFKRKSESEFEASQEPMTTSTAESEEGKEIPEIDSNETKETVKKETPTAGRGPGRRRRSKASKEEETKINSEESLALRRARRPGARKSYLNEVIEKVIDEDAKLEGEKKEVKEVEAEDKVESKPTKEEAGSSSRRKQDFKHHTLGSDREEIVYSEIVSSEQKAKCEPEKKKSKTQSKDRRGHSEDLNAQIDNLLEETKPSSVPDISESSNEKVEKSEELKSTNFSFDYVPTEQTGRRGAKTSKEIKSISRMFLDTVLNSEDGSEVVEGSQSETKGNESKEPTEEKVSGDGQKSLKFSSTSTNASSGQKRGSIVLSSMPAGGEAALTKVKVLPVMRPGSAGKDCVVLPSGKKAKTGEESESNASEAETRPKNIKAIKVKSDSLPPSLITAGKLKGQTIIHQKGGKYVIVTQSPPLGRQKTSPGKVQSGSKVVILTNQLGEQKIITASGLQQTKFKVDGQKVVADSGADKETGASTSGNPVGQTQPIIKMVPDGKGGIMKQLTVSPKKVLLGGTKVFVSASGSTFSAGNNVQKLTLSGGAGVARAGGGDFRLIENYKGSGKTVLIQGSSNASSGVVLKPATGLPRQVTKVLQSPQTGGVQGLKKKPKILMRASTSQGEFVMQPAESPTFVVKQKGTDGKYSAQKFVRTDIVNQPKASLSGTGTKAFFISGQSANKKGESYIITTNESVPGKVIRMRQKIKDVDMASAKAQVPQKGSEIYAISQSNLLLSSETPTESETPQIVQIQEQSQQPVLQTQVIAMPGPVGADGNQTYVLVSVDENGVVQGMDNSVVAYDATAQPDSIFVNPTSTNNVILINPQTNDEVAPVFSTSSQDILAEALANTNVLEGNINNEMESVVPSILLPPSIPSSVVQETSITLQKPIMTPLEMPSSVTPDTSGLEPPPLPPTPTEEDVLMEESDMSGGVMQEHQEKDGGTNSTDSMQTFLESENYETVKSSEPLLQLSDFSKDDGEQKIFDEKGEEEKKLTEYYSERLNENAGGQEEQKEHPQEDYLIENSQEQSNSFQSLPVLNDEPDTSDDVQGTEPVPEQAFDAEKSKTEPVQFSQLLREQEPPSSTNNEMTESHQEVKFEGSKYENYHHQPYESGDQTKGESKSKEPEMRIGEEQCEGPKEKETVGNKESQSLPVIAEENNINSYDMDPIYSDVMSQKRFQEETEVSSTTDEFSNKDVTN